MVKMGQILRYLKTVMGSNQSDKGIMANKHLCKIWTYVEFPDDFDEITENILISIIVALSEICHRMFFFLKISSIQMVTMVIEKEHLE